MPDTFLRLDGATSYGSVSNHGSLLSNDFTLRLLFRSFDGANGSAGVLVSLGDRGNGDLAWQVIESSGKLIFRVSDDGSLSAGHYQEYQSSKVWLNSLTWRHLVFRSIAGVISVFIDGKIDSGITKLNDDAITTVHATAGSFYVGAEYVTGTGIAGYFPGDIDDISLWSRGLTDGEVSELYNNGRHKYVHARRDFTASDIAMGSSLALNIHFGASTSIADDCSDNSNDMTLNSCEVVTGGNAAPLWLIPDYRDLNFIFMRRVIDSLLPRKSSGWTIKSQGTLDKFLIIISKIFTLIKNFYVEIGLLWSPQNSIILPTLESMYGVPKVSVLWSEQDRRDYLSAHIKRLRQSATPEELQDILHESGYTTLYVYANDPAVDPLLLNMNSNVTFSFGNQTSVFGNQNAVFSGETGFSIVRGLIYYGFRTSHFSFGSTLAVFGNSNAIFGNAGDDKAEIPEPDMPTDLNYWPLVFFIGGQTVTRDIDGKLTYIETVNLPESQREELIRLIVRRKPLVNWCLAFVTFS